MTKNKKVKILETSYAGFWPRVVALLIDSLILYVIAFFLGFGLSVTVGADSVIKFSKGIALLLSWFYFAWMESKQGATFGKQIINIQVTNINGGPVTFMQATVRYAAKFLSTGTLFIGFIMAGFTKKKQGLHDIISECLVVKK